MASTTPTKGVATIGLGAVISIDDLGTGNATGNATYFPITNVISVGIPSPTTGTQPSKTLDLANATLTKIAGIIDSGSLTLKTELVNVSGTNTQYTRFEALRAGRLFHNWKFVVPCDVGNATIVVSALVTQNKINDVAADEITTLDTMLELSGAITVS